jgi:hypothetical protein
MQRPHLDLRAAPRLAVDGEGAAALGRQARRQHVALPAGGAAQLQGRLGGLRAAAAAGPALLSSGHQTMSSPPPPPSATWEITAGRRRQQRAHLAAGAVAARHVAQRGAAQRPGAAAGGEGGRLEQVGLAGAVGADDRDEAAGGQRHLRAAAGAAASGQGC